MTSRQFDTTIPTAKAEIAAARQTDVAKGQVTDGAHHDRLAGSALRAGSIPDDSRARAAMLLQASGGRLGRVGTALLQLQRDQGNRYVQQVVTHARRPEGAPPSLHDQAPLASAAGAAGGQAHASLQGSISAARRGGRALDGGVGAQMGQAFGSDFSDVMVHADARADALTRSLRASAFTVGRDIFFSRGAYAPGTSSGRELLAHELAHVVQQAAARAGASSRMIVGPANDHHERAADRAAAEIARAGRARPLASVSSEPSGVGTGRIGSGAGKTVQRTYLDQKPATAGYKAWENDTTVKRLFGKASRGKLAEVDGLLWIVLTQMGEPAEWMYRGEQSLKLLEAALARYNQGTSAKQNTDSVKQAVYQLDTEIQQALAWINLKKLAAQGRQAAEPVGTQPVGTQPVRRPSQAEMVAELKKVGFVDSYLNSLAPSGDLDLLYDAHMKLGARHLPEAQQLLDKLNPLTPATRPAPNEELWKQEQYEKSSVPGLYDFERAAPKSGNTMAAQRQLLAYHAATIGENATAMSARGGYAKLMSYKPYKKAALSPAEVAEGKKYFKRERLRAWKDVLQGSRGDAPLEQAVAQAPDIAKAATAASAARSAAKNREPKPKKQALTEEEVTAIRVYTSESYQEMNAVLRDFRVGEPTANWEKYSAIAKLAISGLGKLPKARDTTSYRGDNDIKFAGHAGVLKFGATFRLPNFYSTTKDAGRAFNGVLGYIFHNKRAGRLIEAFSQFKGEAEVLIPPGTAFKITGEYHLQAGTWVSHDGKKVSDPPTSPSDSAVNTFLKGNKKEREKILEFTEIT